MAADIKAALDNSLQMQLQLQMQMQMQGQGQGLGQGQGQGQSDNTSNASSTFSIADFLVPGIQPRGWEDWQVPDELNPFASGNGSQDFASGNFNNAMMPFDLLSSAQTLWDPSAAASGLPMDQAYDELVFDLAPSNFETPATVNIADLIVGPDSLTPVSVSPLELSFPVNHNNYQDLALANFYGFTEQDGLAEDDLDSGSDLSELDSDMSFDDSDEDQEEDDEEEEEEEEDEDHDMAVETESQDFPLKETTETESVEESLLEHPVKDTAQEMIMVAESTASFSSSAPEPIPFFNKVEDVNKRRMEEALVARISNDLGPEHMAGLFRILKGADGAKNEAEEDEEDEEMEVDLSSLDESTLVQVYQYVEMCCMQTVRSVLEAEERERQDQEQRRIRQAQEAAAREEAAYQERQRLYGARTPELSPSYSSSGSSSSPSPPHPSSTPPARSRSGNNNKRRPATASSGCTVYREHSDMEDDSLWMGTQVKSKRKRGDNNSAICMGGGGTSKGRRIQKLNNTHVYHQQYVAVGSGDEEMEEYGEDDEIDVVGI
ncbi:hypothetical protein BGZ94_001633 [Podila epigama]|nr:hypothetical protein BGZ94_001633 [Podila epigama]